MRVGENPTKFNRKNPKISNLSVKIPKNLTLATITYIPHLFGYYKQCFDVLKLSLASIMHNTSTPFDLMVFDNGSCDKVIDYLVELKRNDLIQWLFLSSKNMKKLGAWNIIFPATQGEFVYYFDSDIFHYPGWFNESMKIMSTYPKAGLVAACPFISVRHVKSSIMIAESDPEIKIERGHFVKEEIFRKIALSLGANTEHYIKKKKSQTQIQLTKDNVQSVISASHSQFLGRAELFHKIFPRPKDWALKYTDKEFDRLVDELGYMRLSTLNMGIYHLGNTLSKEWLTELAKYNLDAVNVQENVSKAYPNLIRRLLKFKPIHTLILRLYALIFNLLYADN